MWKALHHLKLQKRLPYAILRNNSSLVHQQIIQPNETTSLNLNYHNFIKGTEFEGFKVSQVEYIKDFQCYLIKLHHTDTGVEYIHINRNDSNNVFAIAFRTTPFNSTGLPHILEHITLCGSNKYPCRDPFFKMLNRSLATFMNAMTGPDYTVYPFSTQNYADYYNLMSVYLDAVFRPQLRECDFRQEGWRLEHEDVYNSQSPIIFKGVVFNEMKGVFSENQTIFMESLLNNLLPSHTYGFISGGDPLIIPQLTHQNLINFHKKYYHPSNCKIYSYGNFSLHNHLKFINESYLQMYKNDYNYSEHTQVPLEPRWICPRKKHIYGRYDPLAPDQEKQSIFATSYLCEDISNIKENFVLKVITKLLIEGPNSPFYKSLIEANIGTGYAPATGFETQTRDTSFTVGLQGISTNDFDHIQELISNTLSKTIEEGFDEKNIENILHSIELNIKHQQSNFGLDLLFGITSLWNHNGDVINALKINEHISELREELKNNPHYLQQNVKKYFENNNHCLVLTMSVNENYENEIKNKEAQVFEEKLSNLSKEEKDQIYENGIQLRIEQEKKEDLNCLPTLKISDIKPSISHDPLNEITCEKVPIQVCVLPTNGVSYFNAIINTSELPEELKVILPLFSDIICEMGTNKNDYRVFDQLVHMKTGGLHVSTHVAEDINNNSQFEEAICLSSHCLDRNIEGMFALWNEIIGEVCLNDVSRFATLVREISGDLLTGIADDGHAYAMSCASSMINSAAYRKETFSGLAYIYKMKEIAQIENLTAILEQIKQIADYVMKKKYLRCSINLSPETEETTLPHLFNMIRNLPGNLEEPILKSSVDIHQKGNNQKHYVFPFAVNYTAKCLPGVAYTNADFATLKILCRLLTTKYLLPLIREKYGAYGAGALVSPAGVIQFYSYRDPNSLSSLEIFDEAIEWIKKHELTENDINEAKLGVFQNVDMPIPPSSKGMRLFLYGITDNIFNKYRTDLLNVNRESLLNVANKYLGHENFAKVIIGPENNNTSTWIKVE